MALNTATLRITPEVLSLTAEIDEFKGAWRAIVRIAPERLSGLRRVEVIAETKPVASRLTLDSATYEVDFRWHQHGRRQPVAR